MKTVRNVILPALDDEFAKLVGKYESIDALREALTKEIEARARAEYDDKYYAEIVDRLREGAQIKYAPQTLEHEAEHVVNDMRRRLAQQGLDLDTYYKMRNTDAVKFFEEEAKPVARKRLERSLILDEVARAEKIQVDNEALDEEFNSTLLDIQGQGLNLGAIRGAGRVRHLGMDYIDIYLIHWPRAGWKYEETFRALNKLVRDGKVKHLGVSNFNLKLHKQAQALSETPIVTNQVPYSLADRSYVDNGVIEYCMQNDILVMASEPVDKGHLRPNKKLASIAEAHNATLFQIALAWLAAQPRVITIPMAFNPQHIKENFVAAEIELTPDEIELLTGKM